MAYTARPLATGIALALGASLALACGGSDDVPDMGNGSPDMGVADTGTPDMGPADTGVPTACNPTDGSGCPGADQFCVLSYNMGEGACRTLPDQKTFGAVCDPALQDCAPGLACLAFQGDANPTCHQACTASGGAECNNVPDMSQTYACVTTPDVMSATYGACRGNGTSCNPLDMMPCAAGQTCSLSSANFGTSCTMAGTTQLGGTCTMSNCAEGQGMCVNLGGAQLCYEPCNLNLPNCSQAGYSCQMITSMGMSAPWGLCLPPQMTSCNPITNPCPTGQVCAVTQDNMSVECVMEGTVQLGGDCSMMNCAEGGFCVPTNQGGRVCAQPCDLAAPMCPMNQMCQDIGLPFGLCG